MPTEDRPTARQQRYLRSLAQKTGTSFIPPATKTQASREIKRLKKLAASPRHERKGDQRAVSERLATGTSGRARAQGRGQRLRLEVSVVAFDASR